MPQRAILPLLLIPHVHWDPDKSMGVFICQVLLSVAVPSLSLTQRALAGTGKLDSLRKRFLQGKPASLWSRLVWQMAWDAARAVNYQY